MPSISRETVEKHLDFFVQCAADYRTLATELIHQLAKQLVVEINYSCPLISFNPYRYSGNDSGKMGNWQYYFHGFHCRFYHLITQQSIEVPLTYGKEFGELDPAFFVEYIASTRQYQPLPFSLENPCYPTGEVILNTMLELEYLDVIPSNISVNIKGVALKNSRREPIPFTFDELLWNHKPLRKRKCLKLFLKRLLSFNN